MRDRTWRDDRGARAGDLSACSNRCYVRLVGAFESFRQQMQLAIATAERLQRGDGFEHIIAIGAGFSVSLPYMMQLLIEREPAGILRVAMIDHVTDRIDTAPRLTNEPYRAHCLTINLSHLLARSQVGKGRGSLSRRYTKGNAAAGATVVKPEYKPWPFGCTAVNKRIDAERTVQADYARRRALDESKARPPHQ